MTEEMNNKFDFVIGTLQICIGILEKMKSEDKTTYPMHVGLLTEMINSFTELRSEIQKEIDTPVN
tara:strand:- start:113 stop:307 length:195 start_codon:yes stop_codon:yes gene_type:complete